MANTNVLDQGSEQVPQLAQSEPELKRDNWKHRSKGMRCSTCMFFVPKVRADEDNRPDEPIGRCRRHAPTMSGWPVMKPSDWCGDHKLDENKS